jgi:hypothetical protein
LAMIGWAQSPIRVRFPCIESLSRREGAKNA